VQHLVSPGAEITFVGVQVRLQWGLYLVSDLLLLVFAVFHGLNGLRTVILDFNVSPRVASLLTVALAVFGTVVILYGVEPVLAFVAR
jgi:succinate dehydrogenase hydrophobic anchor subunit